MGETPIHRRNIGNTIEMLEARFADDPMVYVSGDMFVYYVPGNRHLSVVPDVFVVKGVRKTPERRVYLIWEEGKGPDVIIEVTSLTSREEDQDDKFVLYRDTLRVYEYFLFDPEGAYLDPPLQGYRLNQGEYLAIEPVDGRLPSEVLGLHLERDGTELRLYDPVSRKWLLTAREVREALQRTEVQREQAKAAQQEEVAARRKAEAEVERLRRELEALRQNPPKQP